MKVKDMYTNVELVGAWFVVPTQTGTMMIEYNPDDQKLMDIVDGTVIESILDFKALILREDEIYLKDRLLGLIDRTYDYYESDLEYNSPETAKSFGKLLGEFCSVLLEHQTSVVKCMFTYRDTASGEIYELDGPYFLA